MKVRLPGRSNRIVLIGRTGTGKTVAGLWHLSNYDLSRPWIILNFKNDEHIESIEKAQHVPLGFVPQKKDEGLFVVHPHPYDARRISPKEPSPLEAYMFKIWERGNCGIFCDEAFMMGDNDGYDTCQTQGRSLGIPMITCTQRPVWVSRFCFSEASFIQCFDLIDARDKSTVEGFVPIDFDEDDLGDHESWYFDVAKKQLVKFAPVPNMDTIRETFDAKLKHRKVRI